MKKIVILALVLSTLTISAQKRKDKEGSIKNLKGISAYNLVFDQENLKVDKFDTEEAFLEDKMSKREDKEAGKGEEFKKNQFADRENRYEPKFIESFNKRFDADEMIAAKNLTEAKHTMKIKTTWIYPGYNVGVMRQPAKLNATMSVYVTDNPNKILYSADYSKALGKGAMGYDFNSGYRISESYAKLAKTLASHIKKKAK